MTTANEITETELKVLTAVNNRDDVFDIGDTGDPEKAEIFWSDLEKRGYVTISNFARCGFEKVAGRFVALTEAGTSLIESQEL